MELGLRRNGTWIQNSQAATPEYKEDFVEDKGHLSGKDVRN